MSYKPRFECLEARDCPAVSYGGGPVLSGAVVRPVFYGAEWAAWPAALLETAAIDCVLADLADSPWWGVLAREYGVASPRVAGGQVIDGPLSGPGWLDDGLLQTVLRGGKAPRGDTLWAVFVEPGVAVSLLGSNSQVGFAGYHYTDYAGLCYFVVTYPGPVEGSPWPNSRLGGTSGVLDARDQLTVAASHELAEAATDPLPGTGWLDITRPARAEVGDLAEGDTVVYHGAYAVQLIAGRDDAPAYPPDYVLGAG